jgi:hypothetical protein
MLLMFRGFFDECNRNSEDVRFIMAGWTATVEEWERFSDAWEKCLSTEPSIKYFKTYGSDEFYKFSLADKDAKVLALSRVIAAHDLRGYVALVEHSLLANRPLKLRKSMGTRIYDWAFIDIIQNVLADLLNRGCTEKIDFVFDKCSELRACIESYESQRDTEFPQSMRDISGIVIPGDDKDLAGLQAADLLAGEHSLYLRTNTKSAAYAEIDNAHIPMLAFSARTPRREIERKRQSKGTVDGA